MANARLIEQLDHSRAELAARADVERSLREIAARISAASDLPAVLQGAVDEAVRLLDADGARVDLIEPATNQLSGAYISGRRSARGVGQGIPTPTRRSTRGSPGRLCSAPARSGPATT